MTKELRFVALFMLSLFLFGQTKAQSGAPRHSQVLKVMAGM